MEPSSSQIPLFTPKSSLIPDLSSPLSNPEDQRSQVGVEWSWDENKAFENALAEFGFESELLLPNLALRIPAKSISQLEDHLKALEDDINMIESSDFEEILNLVKSDDNTDDSSQQGSMNNNEQQEAPKKPAESSRSVPRQRRKGIPWTKTEHEMFLVGLDRYGRGDWRSISKYLVPSKTSTQVASHAQKYFLKLENPKSRPRKDGSFMRTVDDSPKPAATNAQLTISDDKKP